MIQERLINSSLGCVLTGLSVSALTLVVLLLGGYRYYRAEPVRVALPDDAAARPVVHGPGIAGEEGHTPQQESVTVVPEPLALSESRQGLVWEAEWSDSLSGVFECLPAVNTGQNIAVWALEGAGRNLADSMTPRFAAHDKERRGSLRYTVDVPESGTYRIHMRMWAMDVCGNSCWVAVDGEERYHFFPAGRNVPWPGQMYRKWVWINDDGITYRLAKGPHTIHVELREDGIGFDQIALLPTHLPAPKGIQQPNVFPHCLGGSNPHSGCEFLSVNVGIENRCVPQSGPRTVRGAVSLRTRFHVAQVVTVELECPGATIRPAKAITTSLTGAAPFLFLPINVEFSAKAPMRRHQLTVQITTSARPDTPTVVMRLLDAPLEWHVSRPFVRRWRARTKIGPADAWANAARGPWERAVAPDHYNAFGALDLNEILGRRLNCGVYAITRISVKETGDYTLTAAGDDTLTLWCDDQQLVDVAYAKPLSDKLTRRPVYLAAGEHTLTAYVGQEERWWQMLVRFGDQHGNPTPNITGITGWNPLKQ